MDTVQEALDEDVSIEQVIAFLKAHNRHYAAALVRKIHERKKVEVANGDKLD